MTKRLKTLIGALLLGGLLIAFTIKFIRRDINLDLDKSTRVTGKVVDMGVVEKSSKNWKGKVFFLQLDNLNEILATYRPEQQYTVLLNNINVGDTVTVYYDPGRSGALNLDVFQIEKNRKVLQDYQSYNKNHRIIAWLTGICGSLMIVLAILSYRRGWT